MAVNIIYTLEFCSLCLIKRNVYFKSMTEHPVIPFNTNATQKL